MLISLPSFLLRMHDNVSLAGFWAGGEIGPKARAGNKNPYQEGRASFQGFTAVYGVFVVPVYTRYVHVK